MFQQQETRPWYQTLPGLIIVCVLLPPVGIVLLWISAIFTIYTGWDYFRAGIHHLIKEDEG